MDTQDRAAFIAAIIAKPNDDLPRLYYADWLYDNGEPERSEFIRVQCELATMQERHRRDCVGTITGDIESAALRRREREIAEKHGKEWVAAILSLS